MQVSAHGASIPRRVLLRSGFFKGVLMKPRSCSRVSTTSPTRPVPLSRSGLRAVRPRLREHSSSADWTR